MCLRQLTQPFTGYLWMSLFVSSASEDLTTPSNQSSPFHHSAIPRPALSSVPPSVLSLRTVQDFREVFSHERLRPPEAGFLAAGGGRTAGAPRRKRKAEPLVGKVFRASGLSQILMP